MKKIIVGIIFVIISIFIGGYFGNTFKDSNAKINDQSQSPSPQIVSATPTPDPKLPSKLSIPSLNIDANVESVGLDSEDKMDVPKDAANVAWYNLGAKPGAVGNSVMAGHLDTISGQPAVFYDLSKIQIGDEIITTDADGKNYTFKVSRKETYPSNAFPLQEVFGARDTPRLNLITCEGSFNSATRNYSHRTVVYADLVG